MARDINFCTPMSHSTEDLNLQERQIGISVAESADIANFGIGEEMFKDLIIELTRHILKANGSLIYGGIYGVRAIRNCLEIWLDNTGKKKKQRLMYII